MQAIRGVALFTICSVLVLAAPVGAQVKLLNVGQARAGTVPTSLAPDWLAPVPVRTNYERALFPFRYPDLTALMVRSAVIPGLTGPMIPQGVAALPDGRVALTYYTKDAKDSGPAGSVLALVDGSTGAPLAVRELKDTDGKPLDLHVGGLAAWGGYLYTGGDGRILRFPVPAGPGRWLTAERSWNLDATVSFVSAYAGTLWVGDFYRDGERPPSRGWAAAYFMDATGSAPLSGASYLRAGRRVLRPDAVIDLPTQVQGFALANDRVALARSHGTADGELEFWQSPLNGLPRTVSLPGGYTTSGWSLATKERVVRIPSGTEDLEWQPPHLLIAFESGAQEYRDDWRGRGALIEDRFMFLELP